jgi:hypothetical protein
MNYPQYPKSVEHGRRDRSFAWALPCALAFFAGCAPVTYIAQPQPPDAGGPPPQPAYYPETPPAPATPYAPPAETAPATANPLDELMAPVALYPDPLISILLPASTFPSDISSAGQYLAAGGDPGQVDAQPWDPSVRSLAHYPDVVTWMAANGPWVQAVGAAFVSDPAQVMQAIQRLRELARAAGTLEDTPQQQVIVEDSFVEIVPAQPNVIYVPLYDPEIVFVDQPYYDYNGPYVSYGPPYQAGVWLTYGCDWQGGGVGIVDSSYWYGDRGAWRRNGPEPVNAWHYPANRPRPQAPSGWRQNPKAVQVRPIAGAPPRPPQPAFRDIRTRGPAAVTAVSRNPAAFKGQPIHPAVLPRNTSAPARGNEPAPTPINQRSPSISPPVQGNRSTGGATPAPARHAPTPQAAPNPMHSFTATPTPRIQSPTQRPRPTATAPTAQPRPFVPTERPRVEHEMTPTPRPANVQREPTPAPKVRTGQTNRQTERPTEMEQRPTPKPAPRPSPKPIPRPTPIPTPGQ